MVVTSPIEKLDSDCCIAIIKKMQGSDKENLQVFDFKERIRTVLDYLDDNQHLRLKKFADIEEGIMAMLTMIENDHWDKRFSHNAISKEKFRLCDSNVILSDWRFAGVNDIGYDIAEIACLFSDNGEMDESVVTAFLDGTTETKRHLYACKAVCRKLPLMYAGTPFALIWQNPG